MGKEDIHGLAATIRSATSSETFDLGGLPSTTISQVVQDAFSRDFELDDGGMIRITLVVGAGKGNRSKYDPAALKLVTTSLTAAGYIEDRGASCVIESAGCFKFQHDTGKNLKTVVVFPKIAKERGDNSTSSAPLSSSFLPPDSLEFKIAVSTVPLFTNMIKFKFSSWSQKRSLLKLMDETLVEPLDKLDAMLMRGKPLSEDESMFYEQCISILEKKGLVKDAMGQQVQEEKLTALEVEFLLDQVAARMEDLKSNKKTIPNALQERQAKLQSIAKNPIPLPPLKHHAALGKLWKQAAPLMYLNASGGQLLSPSETKKRGQLEDIMREIADLEESSRGLLEDDESYDERIRSYRRELQQRYGNIRGEKGGQKKKRIAGDGALSSNRKTSAWNSTTKFQTPNMVAKGAAGKFKKSKVGSRNKGDVFGAMMADSDSDSDEEEENGYKNRVDPRPDLNPGLAKGSPPASTGGTNSGGTNKKNKKKKKKNKAKGDKLRQGDDDVLLETAVASKETKANDERKSNIFFDLISFLFIVITEWIIPFLLAVVVWFASFLFGTGKSKNKKKKKS
jgi:hypothetical protein